MRIPGNQEAACELLSRTCYPVLTRPALSRPSALVAVVVGVAGVFLCFDWAIRNHVRLLSKEAAAAETRASKARAPFL